MESKKHTRTQHSQVLRSIQAQSNTQEQQQNQQLLLRMLMISIEIQRKDNIIRELIELTSGQQPKRIIEELSIKCNKYELQIKTLTQTISMLKQNISSIEIAKNRQVFTSINQFNQELELKVSKLQQKSRKLEHQKIDLEQQLKKMKMDQTLNEFNLFKNEHNEKGRVRQLQTQLGAQRAKLDHERKTINQKNILIEQLKNKILEQDNSKKLIISQYEDRMNVFNLEMSRARDLEVQLASQTGRSQVQRRALQQKNIIIDQLKSKIVNLQTRQHMLTQQYQQRLTATKTDRSKNRELQLQLNAQRNKYQSQRKLVTQQGYLIEQFKRKLAQQEQRQKSVIGQYEQKIISLHNDNIFTGEEVKRLQKDLLEAETKLKMHSTELRKLKRKPMTMCESCELRELGSSSNLIASQKSIRGLDLQNIIDQAQNLFRSNRKVQSLITRQQNICESSIQYYNAPHHSQL